MKRIYNKTLILSLAAATLLVASCQTSFLDTSPTTAVASGIMWTTEEMADAGMAGLWKPLRKSDLSRTQLRWRTMTGSTAPA